MEPREPDNTLDIQVFGLIDNVPPEERLKVAKRILEHVLADAVFEAARLFANAVDEQDMPTRELHLQSLRRLAGL